MFDSLHHFLYDNKWWVAPLALIVAGYFSRRIWRILQSAPEAAVAATRPPSRRTPRPQPADGVPPVQQQFLPDKPQPPASVVAGEESHKHKAQAQTIRIRSEDQRQSTMGNAPTEVMPPRGEPAAAADDADEVGKLFAGLDDALQPSANTSTAPTEPQAKSSDSQRRASRLGVLGFHHSIESNKTPPPGSITAPPEHPPAAASAPADASGAPALDDILARLDRVLADDKPAGAPATRRETPAAPASATAAGKPTAAPAATPPAAKAPMWARADAQDEDLESKPADPGQQLGLFDQDKKA